MQAVEASVRTSFLIFQTDDRRYMLIVVECCYRRLDDIYGEDNIDMDAINFLDLRQVMLRPLLRLIRLSW